MTGARKVLLAVMVGAAIGIPATAAAHAVVFPKRSELKAYEKYVLRVPNERDVATIRIEIRFPHSVRVVSFADVPGWNLEVLRDSAKRIIGAVWTGSLPPERFVELPFVAVNPDSAVTLVWPVFQSYASGERVDWVGGEDAPQPASRTVVQTGSPPGSGLTIALWVCIIALILGLTGLALSFQPWRSSSIPVGS